MIRVLLKRTREKDELIYCFLGYRLDEKLNSLLAEKEYNSLYVGKVKCAMLMDLGLDIDSDLKVYNLTTEETNKFLANFENNSFERYEN